MRIAVLAAIVLSGMLWTICPSATAQEASPEDAPAAPVRGDESLDPVSGGKVEVLLHSGVVIRGVLKSDRAELPAGPGYVKATSRELPGAGVRVFYAFGLDGYLFIPYSTIRVATFPGDLSEEEGSRIARGLEEDRRKADQDRVRAIAELNTKRAARRAAAEEAAKKYAGEVEEEPEEEEFEFTARGPRSSDEESGAEETVPAEPDVHQEVTSERQARESEIAALMERFPPARWNPERLEELKRRAVQQDIFPNEEERAFIRNFDLWLEGYKRLETESQES